MAFNSNSYSGGVHGGCDVETRGQASLDRSIMESENIFNHNDYRAYSEVIHCKNTNNDHDGGDAATINVEPILGKYSNKKF